MLAKATLVCPRCTGMPLRDLRTWQGRVDKCPACHGCWVTPRWGSLSSLITQTVERVALHAQEGRCSRGLHEVRPPDEHCTHCPRTSHRCPACATRLSPSEWQQQAFEVCTRCPGLWVDEKVWESLRSSLSSPRRTFALSLGRGGSIRRPQSLSWGMGLLVLVGAGALSFGSQAFLEGLLQFLWRLLGNG
ncbi:MAG: zf-TFIIB domain-containing protein [Cystobacter sp.]